MTAVIKQRAHELIEALPDDATWQDLMYALDLRADVESVAFEQHSLARGRAVEMDVAPAFGFGRTR